MSTSRVASVFDLETGPLDDHILAQTCPPFEASPDPGPFDPETVKYGQTKDPEKKKAKLEECREKHETERSKLTEKNEKARAEHFEEYKAKAALSACSGYIVALGLGRPRLDGLETRIVAGEEDQILRTLWSIYSHAQSNDGRFIGWNIFGFDMRFAVQRSRILGVPVPESVIQIRSGRANWSACLVDLMQVWTCGAFGGESYCKLDDACTAMGLPRKNGAGADFHGLWTSGLAGQRQQAKLYLENDLTMAWRVAERLAVA